MRPLISPMGCLFFAGVMSRLTSSPALNVFLLQPLPAWVTGFHASSTQCSTLPLSSLASTFTNTCGFDHTYSVTVPFTVTVLPESKEAAPWWANNGTANAKPTIPTTAPSLFAMKSSKACGQWYSVYSANDTESPLQSARLRRPCKSIRRHVDVRLYVRQLKY